MFDSWVTEGEKYKLPPSYFTENFYFVGTEKKKRLSEEAGLKAISWLAEDRITGVKGLNKHVFIKTFARLHMQFAIGLRAKKLISAVWPSRPLSSV